LSDQPQEERPFAGGFAASVLLSDEAGHVLLVRHNYGLRRWSLPGGVVEPNETVRETALREAREEIGVEVEIGGLHGKYYVHGLERPPVNSHVFLATIRSGVPHIADKNEIAAIRWCNPVRPPAPLTNDARAALSDYARGQSGSARMVARLT